MDEVWADGEADPGVFFGETDRSRKTNWKALQLCKQVERVASLTLAMECESDALAGGGTAARAGPQRRDAELLQHVGVILARELVEPRALLGGELERIPRDGRRLRCGSGWRLRGGGRGQ